MSDTQIFKLPAFRLQSGEVVEDLFLSYATFGALDANRSNLILYPTSYGATDADTRWLIGPDGVLDPSKYCIVIPNMFGNGASSSPSNLSDADPARPFPRFTHVDNVRAQRMLLGEAFGVERIALIYGWSMGAQQALHWASLFPDQVERVMSICGTARTTVHNKVFLEGVRAALTADEAFQNDRFVRKPVRGQKAMGRVYAGWALSQAFYRKDLHLKLGYADLESFLVESWENNFLRRDGNDLLAMIDTWMNADISANRSHGGDLARALGAITARVAHIASSTDLYFTSHDMRAEAEFMPNGEFFEIQSDWGHRAGNPVQNPSDAATLKAHVSRILSDFVPA